MFNEFNWFLNNSNLSRIKLVVFDVDGVLTDGGLLINSEGFISRKFNVKDGLGIKLLKKEGIQVAFLSGGKGDSIKLRAKELGIKLCKTNVKDKAKVIVEFQKKVECKFSDTLFVGDDLNDILVKPYVCLLVATRDAALGMKRKAHLILSKDGGKGAVREIVDRLLRAKGLLYKIENEGWLNTNN